MLKGHNIFEVIFLAGFIAGSVMRKVYMNKHKGLKAAKKDSNVVDYILVGAGGVGLAMPLLYLFSPWLDFANYNLPGWCGWAGTLIFAAAIIFLWRSHVDLGRNFSPTLRITETHSFITDGVYRYVRHPMYSAHLLWAIGQGLVLSNWLAGWAFLVLSIPLYIVRIPKEEKMMLEQFGKEYSSYINHTGRLIPRILKKEER